MKKHTLEYVKSFFKDRDCECLADEYVNANTKMPYVCSCGNKAMITFGHFSSGKRCFKCRFRKELPLLTESQNNVIIGSLLGDGWLQSLKKEEHNSRLAKQQSFEKEEYVKWHYDCLQPYSSAIHHYIIPAKTWKNGYFVKDTSSFTFTTCSHPYFTELRHKWYPGEKDENNYTIKKVPKDIELNPQVLSVWFADDGTNDSNYRRIVIYTDGFLEEDVDFLLDRLRQLGFKCGKRKRNSCLKNNCGYRIVFSSDSYNHFIEYVKPFFPWQCLSHKIKVSGRKHYSELLDRNKSGYRGVSWDKFRNKWRAVISVDKKYITIGRFDNIEEAVEARRMADAKYGEVSPGRWMDDRNG